MKPFLKFAGLPVLAVTLALAGCNTMTPATPSQSTNRATLESLPANPGAAQIAVESNARSFRVGDPIRFRITSNRNGRLWIVAVNADDTATVLFPNEVMTDNRISAGTALDVPQKNLGKELRALPPAGQTSLAFIVMPENRNLDDILVLRGQKLSRVGFASDNDWGMTLLKLEVKE